MSQRENWPEFNGYNNIWNFHQENDDFHCGSARTHNLCTQVIQKLHRAQIASVIQLQTVHSENQTFWL